MEIILSCIGLMACGFFYFLPAIIGRKKKNASTLTLCNLFFGWTAIGWIVCLIWALSSD